MSVQQDLTGLVADAATERPDVVAVAEAGGRALTWAELEEQVSRVATGLGSSGVVAGQRVLIALGNRLEFVTAYLGVLRAQAVAVPVNPGSTPVELTRMLADSGSRLAIAEPATLGSVRQAVAALDHARAGGSSDVDPEVLQRAGQVRVVAVDEPPGADELGFDGLLAGDPRPVPPLPDPEKLACLLYTSGTSGTPRAAMLSHRALLANIDQVVRVRPPLVTGDDVVLGVLPLFHVYGLNAVLGAVLRQRARLVLSARFEPEATLDLIEDQACSVVPVAPAVFGHWSRAARLRERLGPVRLVLCGSAPLPTAVGEAFTEATGLPVHQGYGLTEAAPVVTSTLCSSELRSGSVGAALPGIELRLVDDLGQQPPGEDAGEIQLRGDNLFSGYWPDGLGGPDEDGWWATGDVGYLDPGGDLYLVDRVRELVIVSGFNVYPVEVEDVVRQVADVEEVAVIGVHDDETGEAVVAYVRASSGDPHDVESAIRARCEERLARFKRPSRIEVVDQLPLTVTGKVQKGRLRGLERRRATGLLE